MSGKAPPVVKNVKKTTRKDDGVYDLEQQFILRLPPGPAMALRHDVQSGAQNLKDKLAIDLHPDMRHCKLTYGGQVLNAKLVDLPTIIESQKTTDLKTFYKTADISQMLVCTNDDDDSPDELEPQKKKDKEKKYQWNHGITPPLKNVRKRRFRKTLKKKYQEQPDIEKEVKRLFRMDNEAIDVKWEVVIEDSEVQDPEHPEKQVLAQGSLAHRAPKISGKKPAADTSGGSLDMLEVGDIFGDVSDSEDEEKDINVMDSGEEEMSMMSQQGGMQGSSSFLGIHPLDEGTQGTDSMMSGTSMDGDTTVLQSKLEELSQQVQVMRQRRIDLQVQADLLDASELEPVHEEMEQLDEEITKKQQELEILSSMLNQG